jgi:hypothetical protein
MNIKKIIAAGVVASTALCAVPANAASLSFEFGSGGVQFGISDHNRWNGGGWHRNDNQWSQHRNFLSTQEVRRILRSQGYRDINYLDRRGNIYQAEASRNGRRYGLVVSARDGDILNRYRIHRHG